MNEMVQWAITHLTGIVSAKACIFIISVAPILELRGGIVAASLLNVNMWEALPICIIGTIIPIPFILLLVTKVFQWMKTTKLFKPMVERFERTAMEKKDKIEKYEFLGLLLFVGIPLPGTGAWTGALIAALLEIDFKKALLAIVLGIILSAFIMGALSYGLLGFLLGR